MPILESLRIPRIIRAFQGLFAEPRSRSPKAAANPLRAEPPTAHACAVRERLADEMDVLAHLDAERESRRDSRFGKTVEDRIIWGELIELELQYLDEQVSRCCASLPANSNLGTGGLS